MSLKICETIENHVPSTEQVEKDSLQELDITLKSKMNSELPLSKDMLNTESGALSESGPLSERQLSNFDNQNNVKISNSKSHSAGESTKNQKEDTNSEKASSDSATQKSALTVSDKASQDSESLDENKSIMGESKGNSKNIQKPQQKKKMDKNKNKQIDKENISTEAVTEIVHQNQIQISLQEEKPQLSTVTVDVSEPVKESQDKTVPDSPESPDSADRDGDSTKSGTPEENSFQQTLQSEQASSEEITTTLDDQIMTALEQLKQDSENESLRVTEPEKMNKQADVLPEKENEEVEQPVNKVTSDESIEVPEQPDEEQVDDSEEQNKEESDQKEECEQIPITGESEKPQLNGNEEGQEEPTRISEEEIQMEKQNEDQNKDLQADLRTETNGVDKHQISELTDKIMDDLLKNAFRPQPIQTDLKQGKEQEQPEQEVEVQMGEEKLSLQNEYLEIADEEDNLNIRDSFKDQELSKEDAKQIKSPVKIKPGAHSSDGEQSQEEQDEYMELGYQNINNVLFTDTKVMNFGTFMPGGKLLGSNLMIQNITKCEQIIELSVDSSSFRYKIGDLTKLFPTIMKDDSKSMSGKEAGQEEGNTTPARAILPFEIENLKQSDNTSRSNFIRNSEYIHEAWFIENPVSRELTKRITLKLGPQAQQDFIIVNRSPVQVKKTENLLSIINVGLLTYKGEQFGVKHSFENFLKYQYNNDMKLFLNDRKELSQIQRMKVLLAGKVQVPKVTCMKEIFLEDHGLRVMPLAVKKGFQQQIQRFKIPFKNQTSMDVDVEFQFMKTSAVINPSSDKLPGSPTDVDESKVPVMKKGNVMQSQLASPLELAVQPQAMKIGANQQVIMNISARLKNSYLLQQKEIESSTDMTEKQKQKALKAMAKERFHHLLVARIKDTNMMFSYLIQVQLVNQEPQIIPAGQQLRQMAVAGNVGASKPPTADN